MLVRLARLFLAAVLLASGGAKLFSADAARPPEELDLGALAPLFEPPVVLASALVELALALLLATRAWRASLMAILALSIGFLGLLYALAQRGIDAESCGCFGAVRVRTDLHVLLLVGMALVSAGSLATQREAQRAESA